PPLPRYSSLPYPASTRTYPLSLHDALPISRHQHLDGWALGVHGADLAGGGLGAQQQLVGQVEGVLHIPGGVVLGDVQAGKAVVVDRKSTRLNSSHVSSSYAVFCLKKKTAKS